MMMMMIITIIIVINTHPQHQVSNIVYHELTVKCGLPKETPNAGL